jgi:hypothetical protein
LRGGRRPAASIGVRCVGRRKWGAEQLNFSSTFFLPFRLRRALAATPLCRPVVVGACGLIASRPTEMTSRDTCPESYAQSAIQRACNTYITADAYSAAKGGRFRQLQGCVTASLSRRRRSGGAPPADGRFRWKRRSARRVQCPDLIVKHLDRPRPLRSAIVVVGSRVTLALFSAFSATDRLKN